MTDATVAASIAFLLQAMTPDADERAAAAQHRASLEEWLKQDLGIVRMRETGSWHHGTAISPTSDVDYFVTMPDVRPETSYTALKALRASLTEGFPECWVWIDRPAVRVTYPSGGPAVEITPAYFRDADDYNIPDPASNGWIQSNPAIHLEYVNDVQHRTDGKAKSLIRLVKIWKAMNKVPVSSFYLEMRAARFTETTTLPIIYDWDLRDFFRGLAEVGLREMNDPTQYGRRIGVGAASSAELVQATHAVDRAARLAGLMREATERDDEAIAVRHLMSLYHLGMQ
ncbi:nucleotidyltransferase domain-containing protein [Tsukamurella strandjordii]|uniref:Nucleotidyltransferase n=1 Tax=Tsukamurella strandjordii TaxID=147577 RepID=A0AA90S9T7_9ACTN|nr:nucleotidyltransferase [Tsukamurella strandjordii]MDP0400535.1 nucleotidyltransferase [Tsukamurella strandjordii]